MGYVGVAVRVGARDEAPDDFGLAHFVEHTIFKGTLRRRAWHIINRMEAVGGELNAYTTKEETVIYSAFPGNNPRRAAELIADLVANSQFPAAELEKEREVVADEIDSYLDTPSEAVYDDFEDLMFAGSSLGHNILGTSQALESFDSDRCRRYLRRWYVPQNMVVFYAGSMSADRVFGVLEQAFAAVEGPKPQRPAQTVPDYHPFEVHKAIDSHQAHTIMGARVGA
ncbi:MAG: M16 family metallopeptidase, partial [Bradyrhizobium sp.]